MRNNQRASLEEKCWHAQTLESCKSSLSRKTTVFLGTLGAEIEKKNTHTHIQTQNRCRKNRFAVYFLLRSTAYYYFCCLLCVVAADVLHNVTAVHTQTHTHTHIIYRNTYTPERENKLCPYIFYLKNENWGNLGACFVVKRMHACVVFFCSLFIVVSALSCGKSHYFCEYTVNCLWWTAEIKKKTSQSFMGILSSSNAIAMAIRIAVSMRITHKPAVLTLIANRMHACVSVCVCVFLFLFRGSSISGSFRYGWGRRVLHANNVNGFRSSLG